ncbi:MAG: hypothetical protein KDB90_15690 [Planctomycetes bacterium]|nr:hypothetical protein [Planctomycetota bacterium]
MPRDLGKAKRADLAGHFPGEQAEYGSSFAHFLEGSGQLKPLEDGTYLDTPTRGNGNGKGNATEIPGLHTEAPGRGTDTEVAPRTADGNGHSKDNGTDIFDTHFGDSPFGGDEMMPEPAFADDALEPLQPGNGETEALEPVSFEPSADTLLPNAAEPELLDSVPDLTSPELDAGADDGEDQDDTDLLDDPRRNQLQTVRPHTDELPPKREELEDLAPASASDTGMLIAEAFAAPETGGWDEVDFDDDSEPERITDKISRNAQRDEDLTTVHPRRPEVDGEKITNKVEPRRDVDPRAADPNAVVRDTVNFYNQTQSLHEQKKNSGGFPTISPTVVNSTQPLGIRPEAEAGPNAPDLFSEDDSDTDTLKPGPAFGSDEGMSFGPDDEPSLAAMAEPMSLDAESPSLSLEPESAPAELSAESDLEEAEKRETDKFKREDREPPDLPVPEGTDKVDKDAVARERARHQSGEPAGLEPLSDEKVAGGKDTQRFYVSEILAKKDHTGDTTAELVPAEDGPPPMAQPSSETSPDYPTESSAAASARRKAKRPEPQELPEPSDVNTDFLEKVHVSHEDRIVPEIGTDAEYDADFEDDEADEADGDDTVDEEAIEAVNVRAKDDDRITEKLKPGTEPDGAPDAAQAASAVSSWVYPPRAVADSGRRDQPSTRSATAKPRPAAVSAQHSNRVKKITDGLSRRLKQEREETLRLIEQAEAVAVKLREASEASRTDLVALSERRTEIRRRAPDAADLHELPDSADDDPAQDDETGSAATVFEDRPPELNAQRAEVRNARPRSGERVPTKAIGEIVNELQRSAERAPASLSELLDEVSRRQEAAASARLADSNGDVDQEDDLDLLVAASARLRETVESEWEEDRVSGRAPAVPGDEPEPESEPAPAATARRPAAESTLSADLDRLWEVLDSRRHSAAHATVVLPAADKTRISPREDEPLEGWTQELLWPTLAGIAVATFILGALFVWMLVKAWA